MGVRGRIRDLVNRAGEVLGGEAGQGTTEYAILVGVLVLIAIVAILSFRDKISEMWDAIASGINSR
jgi:Flp pilus assembly pilin Flp